MPAFAVPALSEIDPDVLERAHALMPAVQFRQLARHESQHAGVHEVPENESHFEFLDVPAVSHRLVLGYPSRTNLLVDSVGFRAFSCDSQNSVTRTDDRPFVETHRWYGGSIAPPIARTVGFAAYSDRIKYLESVGHEDGIALNDQSLRDFTSFVTGAPSLPKASLVLTDSGNIRAIWKVEGKGQIGVQFQGAGKGSFAITKPDPSPPGDPKPYGERALDALKELVLDFVS